MAKEMFMTKIHYQPILDDVLCADINLSNEDVHTFFIGEDFNKLVKVLVDYLWEIHGSLCGPKDVVKSTMKEIESIIEDINSNARRLNKHGEGPTLVNVPEQDLYIVRNFGRQKLYINIVRLNCTGQDGYTKMVEVF